MNLKVISRNVGYALMVSALFMLLSVFVSVAGGRDSALAALLISFTITFTVGIFPFIFVRKAPAITLKDGYMIIFLSWGLSFIFGMLPYLLWGGPFTVVNAWFESVSGLTATGATILDDIEALPRSLLFWRSSTHFIGGLGVVVFLLLIIPSSSPVRLRLANMELSSLFREGYSSGTNRTVSIFTYVYLAMNAAAFLCYLLCGMSAFDAVNHAFSVCATGGFSIRNLSIGYYGSPAVEWVTVFFMILSSVHFAITYLVIVTRSLKPLRNPVLKYYIGSLLVATVVVMLSLRAQGMPWMTAFRQGGFHVVSFASTTGFGIGDNTLWPMAAVLVLVFMGIQTGMAGSTTGGLKADRMMIILRAVSRQVKRTVRPSSVSEIKIGRHLLKEEDVYPHILYFAVFTLVVIVSFGLCLVFGGDAAESLSGTLSSIGNVGPGVAGAIGTAGTFNSQPAAVKVIFTLDMFLGRLEIYPILAVISMLFTYDRR